jgi:outer membrane protein
MARPRRPQFTSHRIDVSTRRLAQGLAPGRLLGSVLGLVLLLLLVLILIPGRSALGEGLRLESAGATGEVLTLERAMELAVAHNRGLQAAAARGDAARAGVDEARAARRPRVTAGGRYQRTNNPVFVFSNLLSQGNFQEQNFALDRLNNPEPLDHWQGRVDLAYPLWAGGRLRHGLDAAQEGAEATDGETRVARQELLRQVAAHYTTAVLAERRRGVTAAAMAAAERHVALARDLFEHGLVVESDRLQAEVRRLAVAEEQLQAENAARVSRAALNRLLGRPLDTPYRLPAADWADDRGAIEAIPPLAELVAAAHRLRPELQVADHHRNAATERLLQERAERLPWVEAQAAVEANAGQIDDLFDPGDNWAVGVGLRVALFDGGRRRARVERARAELAAVQFQGEDLRSVIALEVHQAHAALQTAEARHEAATRGVELAERSLAIVQDRYQEGLALMTELLETETALTAARLRRETALGDRLRARIDLRRATGRLTMGGL